VVIKPSVMPNLRITEDQQLHINKEGSQTTQFS